MHRLKNSNLLAVLCTLLCCLVFSSMASAQSPQGINYQAVARDTSGQPIGNSALTVEITIADSVALNLNEYVESHNVLTNRFGLFTLVIGEGTLVSGSTVLSFEDIDWSSGDKWIGVTVGGVDMGVSELVSVPFALYAERAGNVVVIDSTDLVGSDFIIYQSNGLNDTTDFSSFAPLSGDTIDTVAIVGDSLLRIVERGDTFDLDITSLFNNDSNELIDTILLGTTQNRTLEIIEGSDTASISLSSLSDSVSFFDLQDDELQLVLSSNNLDTSFVDLSAYKDSVVFDTIENGQIKLVFSGNVNDTSFIDVNDLVNNDTNERITNMVMLPGPNKLLVVAEGSSFSDTVSLNVLSDTIIFNVLEDGILKLVLSSQPLDTSEVDLSSLGASDTNIVSGTLDGGILKLFDNQNDSIEIDLSGLATDQELTDTVAALNVQMDIDSLLFDGRIDSASNAIQAHVLADIDTDTTNERISSVAFDSATNTLTIIENDSTFIVDLSTTSLADSIQSIELLADTAIRIVDGDGSADTLNIASLSTDAELASEVALINSQMNIDSLLFDGRIDSASNAIQAHVLTDIDIDSTNERISVVSFDSASNILTIIENDSTFNVDLSAIALTDSIQLIELLADTAIRIVDGDGSADTLNISSIATDAELASEVASINSQMNIDSLLFDGRIDSASNAIQAHVLGDEDTDSTNEVITGTLISGDTLYIFEAGDTILTDLSQISNSDSLDAFELVNDTILRITDGDGSQYDLSIASFTTDQELTAAIATINAQMDVDSNLFDTRIDSASNAIQAHVLADEDTDAANEVITGTLISGDTLYIFEAGDTIATDLSLISNSDSLDAFELVNDTILRITDGDGSQYDLSIASFTTDHELTAAIATINAQMDVDSNLFDTRIDSASNAIQAHVLADEDTDAANEVITGTLISGDTLYIFEAGDTIATDLSLISNSDSLDAFELINDTILRITDGDGSQYDLSIASFTTDLELTAAIATINAQMDVDSNLFDTRIDSASNAIQAHVLADEDTDAANEVITGTLISGDTLYIFEAGDTILTDLSLISNADSLDAFELVNDTILRITDGDGSQYDLSIASFTTDLELTAAITTINAQMDVDSNLFDTRIDSASNAIQAHVLADEDTDATNEVITGTLISGDTLYIFEAGDTIATDLSLISNSDSLDAFELINDTILRITDGDGSQYDLSIASFTTDLELTAAIATINAQMDVDSNLFDTRIDSASNAIQAHVLADEDTDAANEVITGTLISGDTLYIFEAGDTILTDLSLISNADSLDAFELVNDTILRITDGDGSQYDLSLGSFATVAAMDDSISNINAVIDNDFTVLGDSIQSVSLRLDSIDSLNFDTDTTNEVITGTLISGDTLYIFEAGDTILTDLSLISNADSLDAFELINDTILRITDGDGSQYDLSIASFTTDQELTAAIATINAQMDVDSNLFDTRIDSASNAIQAHVLGDEDTDATNEVITSTLISGDTLYIFEAGDTIATDLSTISNSDSLASFALINDTILRIIDGDGSQYDLSIGSFATDQELAALQLQFDSGTFELDTLEMQDSIIQAQLDSLDGVVDTLQTNLLLLAANDNDTDSLNEIQSLSFNSSSSALTLSSPGSPTPIDLSSLANDATDELIDSMAVLGNNLLIYEGGNAFPDTADLSSFANGAGIDSVFLNITGDTLLVITGLDTSQFAITDADPNNELQTISLNTLNSEIELSNGGGSVKIDTSNTNEIVTDFSLSGNTLSLDEGASPLSVDLSQFEDLDSIRVVGDSLVVYTLNGNDTLNISQGDLDKSSSNELVDSSSVIGTNLLLFQGGNTIPDTVDLSAFSDNAVVDSVYLNGSSDTLIVETNSGTSFYALSDADSTNELQSLSFDSSTKLLTLSNPVTNPASIDLSSLAAANDTVGIQHILAKDSDAGGDSIINLSILQVTDTASISVGSINKLIVSDTLFSPGTAILDSAIVSNLSVNGIYALPTTAPATNQVIKYNGTNLVWSDDSLGLADTITASSINAATGILTLTEGSGSSVDVDLSTLLNDTQDELIDSTRVLGTNLLIFEGGNAFPDTADLSSFANGAGIDSVFLNITGDTLFVTVGLDTSQFAIADADPNNELQTISLNSLTSEIELSNGGGSVKIDTSNTNEVVTDFSLSGNTLSLDEGFSPLSVDLSSFEDLDSIRVVGDSLIVYTLSGNDTLNISGGDLDKSASNELIDSLSLTGNLLKIYEAGSVVDSVDLSSLSPSAGVDSVYLNLAGDTVFVETSAGTTSYAVADGDASNELQDLSINGAGDSLLLSNGTGVALAEIQNTDTLNLIQLNDSNSLIMGTSEATINFNNESFMRFETGKIEVDDDTDLFFGNGLTGQSDDQSTYAGNIGIGMQSLQDNSSGTFNTAIGGRTLQQATGSSNTAIGYHSGVDWGAGNNNTFIGQNSGGQWFGAGSSNVFLGSEAGANQSGGTSITGSIKIGFQSGVFDSTDNRLYIANTSTVAPLIWGNFADSILQINGRLRTSYNGSDTLIYPLADGNPNDVLITDGDGNLSFTSLSSSTIIFTDSTSGVIRLNSSYNDRDFVVGSTTLGISGGEVSRMFFDKTKYAFRAGETTGSEWDDSNVGIGSVAFGENNSAFGDYSAIFGSDNKGDAEYAAIFGSDNEANVSSSYGFITGQDNFINSSGSYNLVAGKDNVANGSYSFALGNFATASANRSAAMGSWLTASNTGSFVIGVGIDASNRITNSDDNSLAIGFNSTIATLFVGSGSGIGTLGRVGIGTTSPTRLLSVNGDMDLTSDESGTALIVTTTGNSATAIEAIANGNNTGQNFALSGIADNSSTINIGVQGQASSDEGTAQNFAVKGIADGSSNIGYAFYAEAENAAINYAGFFNKGLVYVEDSLGIGVTNPTRKFEVLGGAGVDSLFIGGLKFPDANGLGSGNILTYNGTQMIWTAAGLDSNTLAAVLAKSNDANNDSITNLQYINVDTIENQFLSSDLSMIDTLILNTGLFTRARIDSLLSNSMVTDSLIVLGGNDDAGSILIQSGTINELQLESPGEYDWRLRGNDADSNFSIYNEDLDTEVLQINQAGKVAIGQNSNPIDSIQLYVAGTLQVESLKLTSGAADGQVLTSDGSGNATWEDPAAGDNDWDTTSTTVFNATKFVGIGTTNPFNKLDVLDSTGNTTVRIQNSTDGTSITEGLQVTLNGTGNGFNTGVNISATGSNTSNTGVRAAASGSPTQNIGVFGQATGTGATNYAGFFDEGDVFIKDTLILNKTLQLTETPQAGYYLRTDASGFVFADTFAAETCPAGFTAVNEDYCIQSDTNTAATWFNAVLDCNSNHDAGLPSLSEWYTGVSVGTISARSPFDFWEWVDGSTANNTQRAGGGGSNETISMDSPTNTNPYRCIYKLRRN